MTPTQNADKSAAEYGREALAHWMDAARFGARALSERKGSGGLGRRLVEKLLPAGGAAEDGEPATEESPDEDGRGRRRPQADADDEHLFDATAPLPIQESVDVAVPVAAVFDLCSRFEELARFSERISEVEVEDDSHFTVEVKIGGRYQEVALEVIGEEPEERLDWEAVDGFAHAGVVSFHPLAPRLTRVELTIEPESEGPLERLLRLGGLPERAIRQELRRFKAYAELWDEANDYRSADFKDPGTEAAEAEAAQEEEPEAEEPEQDEADEDELDEEAEEPLEEEEPEPAARD
jgi:uncharacterized membrane protein